LRLRGTPSLAHLFRQVALDLPHYEDKNRTLWDARNDLGVFAGPAEQVVSSAIRTQQQVATTVIRPLGSGSDYTVFLQRLGVRGLDSHLFENMY
jgi:N-acetylated-alpha-linked acidic dipeptidase